MKDIIKKSLIWLKLYKPLIGLYNKVVYSFPVLYLSREEFISYKSNKKRAKHQERQKKRLLKFFKGFLKKESFVIDIGANDGLWSEVYLETGASKVVAVEPQEYWLKFLHRKFGDDNRVIIIPKAVGDKAGLAELAICEEVPDISTFSKAFIEQSRFAKQYKWDKVQTVEMITLDNLINTYGKPDYCKIDVEGYELNVVKGLAHAIPMLSFEFHIEFFDETKRICEYLSSIGMRAFNVALGEQMKFSFREWVSKDSLLSYLQSQKDDMLWGDIFVSSEKDIL